LDDDTLPKKTVLLDWNAKAALRHFGFHRRATDNLGLKERPQRLGLYKLSAGLIALKRRAEAIKAIYACAEALLQPQSQQIQDAEA
jgi:hypothetical protein